MPLIENMIAYGRVREDALGCLIDRRGGIVVRKQDGSFWWELQRSRESARVCKIPYKTISRLSSAGNFVQVSLSFLLIFYFIASPLKTLDTSTWTRNSFSSTFSFSLFLFLYEREGS